MDSTLALLAELDRHDAHIAYSTLTKQAILRDGNGRREPVSFDALLALFEKAWITRYESLDGEHHYRITDAGRRASGE